MLKTTSPRPEASANAKPHLPYLGLAIACLAGPIPCQAQDGVSKSLDPTRAQQVIPEPSSREQHQHSGQFELPALPKQGEIAGSGETVTLNQVIFSGNTVFDQQELAALTADFLHKEIRASDIENIRRKVSQHYADHGYINSGAVLASQSLADGVLELNIIEGRLTEVRQTGQGRLQEAYIRDRLIAGSGDPLNVGDLQDSYRLLLGDPLIQQLNGQLLPGKRPGEAILDVKVTRSRPYQLYFSADDYQTPSVGGYTGRMGGWIDNLLTLGERIDAQFIASGGALGYNTGINIPLNGYDTRFTFRYSDITSTIIEKPADVLNITNHVVGFDGGFSQPVYRSFADDLTLGINLAIRQNRTELAGICAKGIETTNDCDTQVTVLRLSQHFSHRGESSSFVFWSTFNAGLDIFGATENTPGNRSGQFFSWLGQSMFTQRLLDNGTHLIVKASIQLADTPVLSLERFAIGGAYTVRGYRENTYVRDNGFNTSVELHVPVYSEDDTENNSLHLVPFWDYGGAWDNPAALDITQAHTDYLFSAGIGFNWQYRQLSADLYWAHAFTPVVNPSLGEHNIQDDGIHFRVNINAF